MKHNIDEPTLQDAIDKACEETRKAYPRACGQLAIDKNHFPINWPREAPARLALARALLASLPEPTPPVVDGKTPGQVAFFILNPHGNWDKLLAGDKDLYEAAASAVLAAFGGQASLDAAIDRMESVPWKDLYDAWDNGIEVEGGINAVRAHLIAAARRTSVYEWWRDGCGTDAMDWKARYEQMHSQAKHHLQLLSDWQTRAEKSEAELAKQKEIADSEFQRATYYEKQAMEAAGNARLSRLRPLSEAGEVPAGAVRVHAWLDTSGGKSRWIYGWLEWEGDTHYADILLPEASQPEPEPATFQAHGKTWTRHTPGDPMPCKESDMIWPLFRGGAMEQKPHEAGSYVWGNFYKEDLGIIGWRYADEPTPEPVHQWQPAVGDVVMLKSGGQKMTVVQVDGTDCRAMWFNGSAIDAGDFYNTTLQPA